MASQLNLDDFEAIWAADFEYSAPPGERPDPICLVARELRSGQTIRLWQDELRDLRTPPYPIGPDSLFVAYFASAELACHLALGWPLPARVLDLFVEFRNRANGLSPPSGFGLLGALSWYGLDAISVTEKESMRDLAIRGGPWTQSEKAALLEYCESDVLALAKLLPKMEPELDLARAVACRGRYMSAVARMEHAGVPIDVETLSRLRSDWGSMQDRLIREVDASYGVYEGRSFKADRWAAWLVRAGIPWPRLESGALALDDDSFKEMSRAYPQVSAMRELRVSLGRLRLHELAVGSDGRNRCLLSPFQSKTARNQPSNSKFIFGPSAWLRGLIKPGPGRSLAYVDWSQQEFGIAAALSGDPAMKEAYQSGDPYLAFGKQAGRIPADATKQTHGAERELFKACVLGVQYGMGEQSLALRIGKPTAYGRDLLRLHRETYPRYWAWSDGAETQAMLIGQLQTVFGWTVRAGADPNPRSLRNFPCQANGAEMLRLACCLATERGISVIAPVHDAILVEGPADSIDEVVAQTQAAMEEASAVILDGFRLRSDAKIVRWPDRYVDERGLEFWGRVMGILDSIGPVRNCDPHCAELLGDPCGIATPV